VAVVVAGLARHDRRFGAPELRIMAMPIALAVRSIALAARSIALAVRSIATETPSIAPAVRSIATETPSIAPAMPSIAPATPSSAPSAKESGRNEKSNMQGSRSIGPGSLALAAYLPRRRAARRRSDVDHPRLTLDRPATKNRTTFMHCRFSLDMHACSN
jgi:hypothetical protein